MTTSKPALTGSITLPAEVGEEAMVVELARQWGADAIRDSDGTELSGEVMDLGLEVYSLTCLVRADQDYPHTHMDQLPQKFLMSDPLTATGPGLVIDPMAGFYREKYILDTKHDAKALWEVIDRTTGEVVPVEKWVFDPATGLVTLSGITPFHVYTVNFLVFQIWDTTSMYNHLTNGWTKPHVISVDPYHPECWDHLMAFFDRFLEEHPHTDVVRLTTLAYHFAVDSDQDSVDKFRDWTGYQDTISVLALEDFAKEYGYRLRAEDFVDQGYYNAACRVPSKGYRDWMAFIHRFVVKYGKALVDKCKARGKRTAIFWGDHWIGVEPFQESFLEMGIDIHVGAAEDGVALRRISDTPGGLVKELRLYPYFFPDVFREGGDPLGESLSNWIKIRRALMRKPVDRLGYGGYLSLALKFPDFVEHVADLCHEFRTFKANSGGGESLKAPIKVAVLNCWGTWKAWINSFGAPQKFLVKRPDVIQVAGTNLLECLAGLPVEVVFLSFDEVAEDGIPADVDVVINDGDAETAWSGGRRWAEPKIVEALRAFVHRGGGFIGCRGPSAFQHQGRYFQLADVMGVDKEVGHTLQSATVKAEVLPAHFITADLQGQPDFGNPETFVYVCDPATQLLAANGLHVMVAAKTFGEGRSVYFGALPYDLTNSRLLHRAIFWAANREREFGRWFSENPNTECAYYPATGQFVVVNNSGHPQRTLVHRGDGTTTEVVLAPYESMWFD
ncbi:1,3-beta-galactosyl-N-acetylhexosamine phosphorylase [Geothrix limicola]|uniref:1,3-beta-galactosyl-N-acetylhexosamine phosphorylase n=1 Tax=Geothrix limicola TaxID=2927978 RepID=A0ABQ5QIM8_9BACT|nr:1,3-beta-galactosyl-N-acetylhexosamine phosphorylase [Geothrix limicola]GLH74722.1 1,3-beta-galactosyl-N-acetylhexosamine phosphorylase [Geothrix limicola]